MTLVLQKLRAGYRLAKDMRPTSNILFVDELKLYGASKDQLDSLTQMVRIFFARNYNVTWARQVCCPGNEKRKTGWQLRNILADDQHMKEVEEEDS